MAKGVAANANGFRKELARLMPGYDWTVHRANPAGCMSATGTQSSGSNRLSTLRVTRREQGGQIRYEAKSAGYGLRAKWLHTNEDGTLARALRGLQDRYETTANTYRSHAEAMEIGRGLAHNAKNPVPTVGPLFKTEITIWSETNPSGMELSELAREADEGDAYCPKRVVRRVSVPEMDADWDGTEFFGVPDDGAAS